MGKEEIINKCREMASSRRVMTFLRGISDKDFRTLVRDEKTSEIASKVKVSYWAFNDLIRERLERKGYGHN